MGNRKKDFEWIMDDVVESINIFVCLLYFKYVTGVVLED